MIDSKEASAALAEIDDIVQRVKQSQLYELDSLAALWWGVLVFAGNVVTWAWPFYARYAWPAVDILGVGGLVAIRLLSPPHSLQRNRIWFNKDSLGLLRLSRLRERPTRSQSVAGEGSRHMGTSSALRDNPDAETPSPQRSQRDRSSSRPASGRGSAPPIWPLHIGWPRRSQEAAFDIRIVLMFALFFAFGHICTDVLGHYGPRELGAFWPIYFMLFYTLAGLWFGTAFVAIGVSIIALTLIGFFTIGAAFPLWMAFFNGGGLIVGGLWMRRI